MHTHRKLMTVMSVDGEMMEGRTEMCKGQPWGSHPIGHRKASKCQVTRWHDQAEFYKEYSGVLYREETGTKGGSFAQKSSDIRGMTMFYLLTELTGREQKRRVPRFRSPPSYFFNMTGSIRQL